ncbi:Metal-dependent hydrolase, endonuclease/exonuclease/phosphatase family [Amycolatopsis pretoriensis]|uniref:Metal-dependent hydrolase, endonuclease/exonuclease/phosphatase family n=1 Tax=Amycolatopsis pretoriensis TaxID=218821 RepID=A0A1H5RAJ0_9PSEU|nr:endonuclease/exonuclease/phosphatase family protein [Amycolatopsis pretoriensis]SEF34427.1 Metal-dependent hydrolase, endonuclease/exonuclease/phosphatase family [Amycolatopsis pretoriensis]
MINFVTANLMNYDGKDPEQYARYAQLVSMLASQKPDILVVQELISGPDNGGDALTRLRAAEDALIDLADALGLTCSADERATASISQTRHHTGVLWRHGIDVVPRRFSPYDSDVYGNSHGMAVVLFDVGGRPLRVGSAHFSHFDPGLSGGWRDAGVVMRAFNRNDGIPGIVGGDWQGIGSDETYDKDPYKGKPWDVSHALHYDLNGEVDRHGAIRLERYGRFRDCAQLVGADWEATTGHHHTDTNEPRRIDRVYVTYNFPEAAVTSYRVVGTDVVGQCTDHRPAVVEVDETKI